MTRAEIETLVPHAGKMCLIDEVLTWDESGIHCLATSHHDAVHPLLENGRFAAIHLIEYGAQATAIHGGIDARAGGAAAAKPGMLVSVRDVQLFVDRIDTISGALEIEAKRLIATPSGWLYDFLIQCDSQCLAKGRIAVMLGP